MKLENQVCSLELAKRLKDLGVKQESFFWWSYGNMCGWYIKCNSTPLKEDYSAFTVSELGAMLPDVIHKNKDFPNEQYFITMDCDKHIYYSNMTNSLEIHIADDEDNEANARAKMLIYLIENGFMKND